jgi:DivIVA domain-containing protein
MVFWFELVIVAGVLFAIAAVATGRGGSMAEAYPDRPDLRLPTDRAVEPADIERLRFSVGLRGYRMHEVDDVLDRLVDELAARDARIRELSDPEPYRPGPEPYRPGPEPYRPGPEPYRPASDQES